MSGRGHIASSPVIALAAVVLCGCTGDKVTEIVIAIGTNLEIPKELEVVAFQVAYANEVPDKGAIPWIIDLEFDVANSANKEHYLHLPAKIGLLPGGDPARTVYILVTGRSNNEPQVNREARLPFAPGRIVQLDMNLLWNCMFKNKTCDKGLTCVEGNCVPIEVDPGYFRPFGDYGKQDARPDRPWPDKRLDAPVAMDAARDTAPAVDKPRNDLGLDATSDKQPLDLKPATDRPLDAKVDKPKTDIKLDKAPPPPDKPPPPPDKPPPVPDKPVPDKPPVKLDGFVCSQPGPTSSCTGTAPDKWCTIGAGCFMMGSQLCSGTSKIPCTEGDENYIQVTLTHSFEMQATEVTVGQWLSRVGPNPSSNQLAACGNSCPVENITYDQAADYCNRLSVAAGKSPCYNCTGSGTSTNCNIAPAYDTPSSKYYTCPGYRLPTEAEQEYATRATTTTDFYSGSIVSCGQDNQLLSIAWYAYNATEKKGVGLKTANAWGLHDLSGNVWEWTADEFANGTCGQTPLMPVGGGCPSTAQSSCGSVIDPILPATPTGSVVMHGGCYQDFAMSLRSANRKKYSRKVPSGVVGFRCVRTLP